MKTLVLIGGGHSHAIALRLLGLQPLPDVRLILISDVADAPYSGMLPGHLAGFYGFAECHIDLRSLANFAHAEFILDAAIGLDLQTNQVLCQEHKPIDFDWLSIDIGSTPAVMDIPGVQNYAIAAKPVPQFLATWQQFVQQDFKQPIALGIVGGGAGGVELALTLQVQLQRICSGGVAVHLFHRQPELMNSYTDTVKRRFQELLIDRGIKLHLNEAVVAIEPKENSLKLVRCRSGLRIPCDQVIWVTQAAAPAWIRQSGLSTDEQGFISIKNTLQALMHPYIFATGDIATMSLNPRPKAGVFAVRQGKPLFANLQHITTGQALQYYLPQQRYLSLIGLGNQQAIATWGNFCTRPSRLLWWWKDRIDRRFMSQFQQTKTYLPEENMINQPISCLNYIGGKWQAASNGGQIESRNPAQWNEIVAIATNSDQTDVELAVQAARAAYRHWRLVPAPVRAEKLLRVGELLQQRKEELATLMSREMGKPIAEARGDVQEGIDCAFYYAGEGRRLFGQTMPSELSNKFAMTVRMPIGVCALITPWNFPVAIPCWKSLPALVCGNTIILKPAKDTPACASMLFEIFAAAGFPPGVVNLLQGSGEVIGSALAEHPGVDLLSLTGSTATGAKVAEICGRTHKRLCLELGGKNAQIVMEDANLELALEGALWGAFGTTGQRCTATSRLLLHSDIKADFTARFLARTKQLKIGAGIEPSNEIGPLVNPAQLGRVKAYIEIARQEGAKVLIGGESIDNPEQGCFFQPTILDGVTPTMRVAREEIFGPVVVLMEVTSFEEAIEMINDSSYGLSSSVYTQDINRAFQAMRDIEAGITYINGPTIGAEVHLPFGGVKQTGNGHREAGNAALDVFSDWKSVYIDFSGKLQRAQIDNR